MNERHRLIYDGDCGFCQWSIERLMARQGPFESEPGDPASSSRLRREVVVLKASGEELGGADAVLFVLQESGWGWFAKMLLHPPFIWVLRGGYWMVARNRHRISRWLRLPATCSVARKRDGNL